MVEHRADFELTKDSPYITLMGELWGIYCEYFGKYWLFYNGTTMYKKNDREKPQHFSH